MAVAGDLTIEDGGQGNVKIHPYLVTLVRWCVSCLWSTATVLLHRLMTTPLQPITGPKPPSKAKPLKFSAGTDHLHPEPTVECQILHQPDTHTMDVIFVHGLYGSLGNTWRQGDWRQKYKNAPQKVTLRNHSTPSCACQEKSHKNLICNDNKCNNENICNDNENKCKDDINDSEMSFTKINEKLSKKIIPNENELITEQFYNNTLLDQIEIVDNYETQAKFVKDLFKKENCDNDCDDKNKHSKCKICKYSNYTNDYVCKDKVDNENICNYSKNNKNICNYNQNICDYDKDNDNIYKYNEKTCDVYKNNKNICNYNQKICDYEDNDDKCNYNKNICNYDDDNENKCEYNENKCDYSEINESNECKCNSNEKKCEVGCGCICSDCYSTCWPKDWIKEDFPGARVISINYTSDPYLWRPLWIKENKRLNLYQRAEQMIEQLLEMRVGDKPIIWVGHSKGGLFIKQIFCEAYEAHLKTNKKTENDINTEKINTKQEEINELSEENSKELSNKMNNNGITAENIDTIISHFSHENNINNDNYMRNNDYIANNDNVMNETKAFDNIFENIKSVCEDNDNKCNFNEINEKIYEGKENLRYECRASLWRHSRGFMFYSVPHRGSPLADIKTPVTARSVDLLEIAKDCPLVLSLQSRWEQAAVHSGTHINVRSFVESCRTLMSVLWLRIVSEHSADAGIGTLSGISVDHREICKPSSRSCLLYTELTDLIHEAIKCRCQ